LSCHFFATAQKSHQQRAACFALLFCLPHKRVTEKATTNEKIKPPFSPPLAGPFVDTQHTWQAMNEALPV
jgi:hypothetical protein